LDLLLQLPDPLLPLDLALKTLIRNDYCQSLLDVSNIYIRFDG